MTIRIAPKKPRRGLISITPYKKISDFRSVGIGCNPIEASRRDATLSSRLFADNQLQKYHFILNYEDNFIQKKVEKYAPY